MVELIRWPEAATVDRAIPKERLYAEAHASTGLKLRFVDEVQRVRWAYKLGEESVRLPPGDFVTEIQVVAIDLKGSDLDNAVLAAIDKTIPSQIIFELRRDDGLGTEWAQTAAYKRSGGRTKSTDYFSTGWIGSDLPRMPLPTSLDMDGLYGRLLGHLLPHPMRSGEGLSDALERMSRIRNLGGEISLLEKRLRTEVQFNRKVELHHQLGARQGELNELTMNEDRMPEDAAWRS